jgi:hypothetical protein
MQRLHKRSAEDLFSYDAMSWMDLVHQLDSRIRGPASGYPLVVMVEPTDDRKGEHLIPCILRGMNRAAPFRYLLLDPLMWSCPIEVHHVLIEHALELLLAEDQQVVQAFLSDAPQIPFANRIGSWCMIRCFENLNRTCCRYTSEEGPKCAIVISNKILGCLPIRGRFPKLLRYPGVGRRSCYSDMDDLA